MANVYLTATTALSTSFNVVTGIANAANAGVTALADLANAASAHSSAYLAETRLELANNAEGRAIRGSQRNGMEIARDLLSMQAELDANPALNAMYIKVRAEQNTLRAVPTAA
jgi:hypothetical protein